MRTGIQPNQRASISRGLQALFPRGHRQNFDVFKALRKEEGERNGMGEEEKEEGEEEKKEGEGRVGGKKREEDKGWV